MNGSKLSRIVALFLLVLSIDPAFAHGYKLGDLDIIHPWTRATPAGADVAGGYLEVANKGQTADRLVSVEVVGVHMTVVHEMAMKDGVMTMRPLAGGLEIPAGATVTLKPGSYHVMMMGLSKPFAAGEMIQATLHFEKAGTISIEFKVDAMGSNGSATHDHGAMPVN
jgi:copper(I)-binding protein